MKLDEFLPTWQFNKVPTADVDAPPGQVFITIKELTPVELSPLIFWMLDLRNLPAKPLGKPAPTATQSGPFLAQLCQGRFIPLAEDPGKEIVFGLIGQFWKLTFGEEPHIPSPEAFLAFDDPVFAKVAANLAVTVDEQGCTHCSTETRIYVPDSKTYRKFAFYWRIISMGSALIRVLWLRVIKRKAEQE